MLNGTLKPYLLYSAAGHAALIVILGIFMSRATTRPPQIYHMIDLNASAGIINRTPGTKKEAPAKKAAPPKAASQTPAPQKDPDAFDTRKRGPSKPLPRPSFLSAPVSPTKKEEAAPAAPIAAPADLESEASIGPVGEATSLTAIDMPDFPYPWYVTQLRAAIWERWTARVFSGEGNCGIRFTIMRDGRAVDVRVEFTSGDKGFDYAALSAVRDAEPFPPLPPDFKDKFLNIHFEFKSR